MNTEKLDLKGICFGEILWDNLPTGRKLGGAPLNVAYHLNKLGIHTEMLTRIGNDQDGDDLVAICEKLDVPVRLFQRDEIQPTSTVEVSLDEQGDVRYEIVFPVAWDFIAAGEKELHAVQHSDFFVFGSLSTRNDKSYQTLKLLLNVVKFKVFDVNLRAPFYSKERIFELLNYADFVKMNEEELGFIADWLSLETTLNDHQKVEQIMHAFEVKEIIVTYGAKGAIFHSEIEKFSFQFPAFKVQVKDTIGSGDSFLAAFISQRCRQDKVTSPEEMLEFATTLSAFVTQSSGACPSYEASTINHFQWKYLLDKELRPSN